MEVALILMIYYVRNNLKSMTSHLPNAWERIMVLLNTKSVGSVARQFCGNRITPFALSLYAVRQSGLCHGVTLDLRWVLSSCFVSGMTIITDHWIGIWISCPCSRYNCLPPTTAHSADTVFSNTRWFLLSGSSINLISNWRSSYQIFIGFANWHSPNYDQIG